MPRDPAHLGEIERHFWLTRSVARSIGVNLTDAIADGRITELDYCLMLTRCRGGGCCEKCELWLAACTGLAEEAPAHCANAETLNNLKPPHLRTKRH